MKVTYKQLTGLGLTATLLGGTALIGCDSEPVTPETAPAEHAEHGEGGENGEAAVAGEGGEAAADAGEHGEATHGEGGEAGEAGHSGHSMETLPVEKRVAFMSGHVEAGLALYRAGAPDQAAKHLLHPVSETHQAERAGIDALGFKPEVFEAVSRALDEGRPAAEIEPMLQAAEENMALMQTNAGGSPHEIIEYLMETVVEEYTIGVKEGAITDPGEFQDAYGFSVVALKTAERVEGKDTTRTVERLQALVEMWPEGGPLADSTPTPVPNVVAQTSKVVLALTDLR